MLLLSLLLFLSFLFDLSFAFTLDEESACRSGESILTHERRIINGPPPLEMPLDLQWAYTRCGNIKMGDFYIDDSRGGKGTHYSHNRKDIESRITASVRELRDARVAPAPKFIDAPLMTRVARALVDPSVAQHLARHPNSTAVVFGSNSPAVESLLLAAGFSLVLTVEYNNLTYDHPQLITARPLDVEAAWAASSSSATPAPENKYKYLTPGSFDFALSISSFDHDGLGRYGDPLAPDGDIMSMITMARYLKDDGLALVAVPVGIDVVWWNVMREYGPVRLPLLISEAQWRVVERIGWVETRFGKERDLKRGTGRPWEPVFILEKKTLIPTTTTPAAVKEEEKEL